MAESIKGPKAAKPKTPSAKRGRPSKAELAARQANEAAGQASADAGGSPLAKPADTAPAFGHNRATEGLFLRHLQTHNGLTANIEELKLRVKEARGKLKDHRTLMKSDGIVLREFDDTLEALETERVDLLAKEERRVLYFEWLGLPTLRSADTVKIEKTPAARWYNLGNIDGRLGKERKIPDGCPPEHGQDWLKGWEHGQAALMADLPITSGKGKGKPDTAGTAGAAAAEVPAGAPVVEPAAEPSPEALLVLKEEDFLTGTELDDCNRSTLIEARLEAWTESDRIVVVIGAKKRVLKEPGYEDTGGEEVEISADDDAEPELLALVEGEGTGAADDTAVDEIREAIREQQLSPVPDQNAPYDDEPAGDETVSANDSQDGGEFA